MMNLKFLFQSFIQRLKTTDILIYVLT